MRMIIAGLAILPLSITAISDIELSQLLHNNHETYLYCDKNHSNMAHVIAEISKLDNDQNSPTWQLHNHIKRGFNIGKEDAIVEALACAEQTLHNNYKALTNDQLAQISAKLNSVIDAVTNGQLTVNTQAILNKPTTQSLLIRSCCNQNSTCEQGKKIKVREKLYVLESAKFFKNVEFKQDVEVQGTLSVADEIIDCDLTVGCDINMHNSVDPTIGNIYKDGNPFIHNFGNSNTFVGIDAGNFNTTGFANVGFGDFALTSNATGSLNTATGAASMASNINGSVNAAHGVLALVSNTQGDANVAMGYLSMASNTTGSGNTALGIASLINNTTGQANTAVGAGAMSSNITGSGNVALGVNAGDNLVSGDNNIYIANVGNASETGIIRIGTPITHTSTFVQGIFGSIVGGGGLAVEVDSTGKLGTTVSSQRFKQDIIEMGAESEKIYDLNPVTFSYTNDDQHSTQYGLIAEEVAEIFPSLIVSDANNNPLAIRYQILPILMLNEVQKQKALIVDLAERVAQLEAAAA